MTKIYLNVQSALRNIRTKVGFSICLSVFELGAGVTDRRTDGRYA